MKWTRFDYIIRDGIAWCLFAALVVCGCRSLADSWATPDEKAEIIEQEQAIEDKGREIVSLESEVDALLAAGLIDDEQHAAMTALIVEGKQEKAAMEDALSEYRGSIVAQGVTGATAFVRDYLPGPAKPLADGVLLLPWLVSPRGRKNLKVAMRGMSPTDGSAKPLDSLRSILSIFGLRHSTPGSAKVADEEIGAVLDKGNPTSTADLAARAKGAPSGSA